MDVSVNAILYLSSPENRTQIADVTDPPHFDLRLGS